MLWYVVNSPFSRFTEAIRSIKVAVDLNGAVKENKIIGITSSLPNEGKSTVAANFAQLIAHAGGRVLLVDLDFEKSVAVAQPRARRGRGCRYYFG